MSEVIATPARGKPSNNIQKRVRLKRILNLRLLTATLISGVVICAISYVWYQYRANRVGQVFEQRALALEKEGKWREAADYLHRYLEFAPNNVDARVRLIEAVEHSASTFDQRRQLVSLLYQTLKYLPDRYDLRLKLANQLLETGDFSAAESEAEKVSLSTDEKNQISAKRIIALSLRARALSGARRSGKSVSIEQASAAMTEALKTTPSDVELASLTAELYREHPNNVGVTDAASEADAILDRLVAANPKQPEALMARYQYRRRYAIEANAQQDLEKVLAIDPNHSEAILLVANEALGRGSEADLQAAEKNFRKVIQLASHDLRAQLGLARVYIAKGKLQQASEVLKKASQSANGPRFEVDALLASMLIELNQLEEATRVLADFDEQFRQLLPQLSTTDRLKIENLGRLVQARLALAKGEFGRATRALNAILATSGQSGTGAGVTERLHATSMLAAIMTRINRLDLAAGYWTAIADQTSGVSEARLKAGSAYLNLGRPADAIVQLEKYLQSPSASREGWIYLVQAHLLQQMRLSTQERNWSEFLTALQQAKEVMPDRWELLIAEALYWKALDTEEMNRRAREQLAYLERGAKGNVTLLQKLVFSYHQLGLAAETERVLEQYDRLEPSFTKRTLVRSMLRAKQGQAGEAMKILADAAAKAADGERRDLQVELVRLQIANRRFDDAEKLLSSLIERAPNDTSLVTLALEMALISEDFASAARWEEALKSAESIDDFDLRFYRARRLIAQYSKLDARARSELDSLVDALRSGRPDSPSVIALVGDHASATGDRRQAIESYLLAIELGERRPQVFEKLVSGLYAEKRYDEANTYLGRLGASSSSEGDSDSIAIRTAIGAQRLDDALELAQQAVKRGSKDPMHHVWLANLLSITSKPHEAERVFRDALKRFPKDNVVWNALFTYLVRTSQTDRARRALERWATEVASDESGEHFILAQGYELLGDMKAAQEQYRQTIELESNSIAARLRLAKLLLATDVAAARVQFEEILKVDPENVEAKRHTASLLAASGREEDWRRAVLLLEADGERNASADDRLRAILLARRGRTRSERLANMQSAREILTTRINQTPDTASDLDRMLLAGLYEQEAVLADDPTLIQKARESWLPLVDRENSSADYLVAYEEWLLRQLERPQNERGYPRDNAQNAALLSEARSRIDKLDMLTADSLTNERRILPVAFRVRLLTLEKRPEEALRLLEEFEQKQMPLARNNTDQAKLLLQLGNSASSAKLHREAEKWYRKLLAITPASYVLVAKSLAAQNKLSEAVNLCLQIAPERPSGEVATFLTQLLLTAEDDPEVNQRIQPLINSEVDGNKGNVELLTAVANKLATEDKYEDAIRLFRRVIELQPNHALALNNLATLLADRPNQLAEARKHIESAMAAAGRSPALLDTLGTILTRMGENDAAVAALEEAVAGATTDPRYYFHLAAAYHRAGQTKKAQEALETALQYGLGGTILTNKDRDLLTSLKKDLFADVRQHSQ